MGCFLPKYIMFELKKSRDELCLIALKIDAYFKGKLTWIFQNDIKNLANFHNINFESLKIATFLWCFYPKQKMCELEFYKEVMCRKKQELTSQFETDMRNLTNFDLST